MLTNVLEMLHTTAAYQTAVMQLMVNEANFTGPQLGIHEIVPPVAAVPAKDWSVDAPPRGAGGTVTSGNYTFGFREGKLCSINKYGWFQKISPPISDLAELADRPSLLDTNSAYQLATQWLAALEVDIASLEKKFPPVIFQVPGRRPGADRRDPSARVAVPLFELGWGGETLSIDTNAILARLRDSGDSLPPATRERIEARLRNPTRPVLPSPSSAVYVKILGTTRELLSLEIRDPSLIRRPALELTNQNELLGPLPPPRHFVEEFVGGAEAYRTVASPDKVEGWLLTRAFASGEFQGNKDRLGPVTLTAQNARQFSDALLNFDSYVWLGGGKSCIVDYGARLRFTRGGDVVEVRLCYECNELEVSHNGHSSLKDFDPARGALVRPLQAAFPKDSTVGALFGN